MPYIEQIEFEIKLLKGWRKANSKIEDLIAERKNKKVWEGIIRVIRATVIALGVFMPGDVTRHTTQSAQKSAYAVQGFFDFLGGIIIDDK
jgi:hypothetical protein